MRTGARNMATEIEHNRLYCSSAKKIKYNLKHKNKQLNRVCFDRQDEESSENESRTIRTPSTYGLEDVMEN